MEYEKGSRFALSSLPCQCLNMRILEGFKASVCVFVSLAIWSIREVEQLDFGVFYSSSGGLFLK